MLIDHEGRRFRIRGLNVMTVRDGKFTSVRCYEDPLSPETARRSVSPMTNTRPIEGKLVRSYSTRFEKDEEPISEGGLWLNGRRDGIDWCDVLTARRASPTAR